MSQKTSAADMLYVGNPYPAALLKLILSEFGLTRSGKSIKYCLLRCNIFVVKNAEQDTTKYLRGSWCTVYIVLNMFV